MFLFWGICQIVITPAYNHFIQYGEYGGVLPSYTALAIGSRHYLLALPLSAAIILLLVYCRYREEEKIHQCQIGIFCSLATITIGLLATAVYGLAAILPYLYVGTGL